MTAVEDLSIVHDRMHAKKMMAVYGYSGKFGPWKEYSDQLYGPSEAIQTYHNLYRQGIIPSYDKDFVFVSPTANSATHEYAMWQIDQQLRIGRGVFVTADIISNPPVFTQTAGQNSVINHVRWNAREFPIRDGSADLIWDRKGLLWYTAQELEIKKTSQMFQAYFKALKPGGSVVIDSISSFSEYYRSLSRVEKQRISWAFRQQVINGEPLNFKSIFPNPPGQIEESTVDKLENLHPHVWRILSRWWDIQDVGSEKTQVRVLIKKS